MAFTDKLESLAAKAESTMAADDDAKWFDFMTPERGIAVARALRAAWNAGDEWLSPTVGRSYHDVIGELRAALAALEAME